MRKLFDTHKKGAIPSKVTAVVAACAMLLTVTVTGTAVALESAADPANQNDQSQTVQQNDGTAGDAQTANDAATDQTANGTEATQPTDGNAQGDAAQNDNTAQNDATAETDPAQSGDAAQQGDATTQQDAAENNDATATTDIAKQSAPAPADQSVAAADEAAPAAVANDSKVKVSLFDYWDIEGRNGPAYDAKKTNVNLATGNSDSNAAFYFGGTGNNRGAWNKWTGSAATTSGIVKTYLEGTGVSAVPQFSSKVTNVNNNQQNMTYLFTDSNYAKAYTNGGNGLTGLFDPTEEANGHYIFDSSQTYAQLNSAGTGFDRSGAWYTGSSASVPRFLPFNNKSDLNTRNYSSVANYAFGMTAYAKFLQPKDGKLADGSAMQFKFNGDDDLWLFVDGMLVLDIGGIHDAADGSIDFSTGVVKVGNSTTTLQALFMQALKDQGKSDAEITAWLDANMAKVNGSYTTFKNYTSHDMNMYYFERGHGGSNCKLDFNLVTVESGQIQIGKETENVPDTDEDKTYTFNAYVNYSGTGSDNDYALYTGQYDVYTDAGALVEAGRSAADGAIPLKAGQYAVLTGSTDDPITESTKYYVVEKNAGDYAVSANGGQVDVTKTGDEATTGKVSVNDTPPVTVLNTVLSAPAHRKYIKKNADGTYTLSLDVTGVKSEQEVTKGSPIDVVLVLDKSGSMEGSRWNTVTAVAKSLANDLLTSANGQLDLSQQVKMSVVGFSTTSSVQALGNGETWSAKASDVTKTIDNMKTGGGTNWEAALRDTNELTTGRGNAKKYIIFLSDGDPTYRVSSYGGKCQENTGWLFPNWVDRPAYTDQASCEANGDSWRWVDPDDKGTSGVHGQGDGDDYGYNYAAAVAEAKRRGDATFFSVSAATAANAKMDQLAGDVGGQYFDGTDQEKLNAAFGKIIDQIKSSLTYSSVTISDTLSDYAEFPSTDATVIDAKVTAKKDGADYDVSAHFNAPVVDRDAKKVSVTAKDGYVLEQGVVYTLSFKIKASDMAYEELAEKGTYPNTGDCGTDVDASASAADGRCGAKTKGATSSGAAGFYSNKEATLTYTVTSKHGETTSTQTEEVPYDDPVLQVELGKIPVEKVWSDGADKHTGDTVTVALKKCDVQGACTDTGKSVVLKKDGDWSGVFENLANGTYQVVETKVNDKDVASSDYNASYSVTDGKATLSVKNGKVEDLAKITVTNTRKTVDLVADSVSVKKTVKGSSTDKDFSFTLKSAGSDQNKDKVIWPNDSKQLTTKVTGHFNAGESKTSSFADKLTFPTEDAEYTFVVTEDGADKAPAGWKYDDSQKTIKVTVKQVNGKWVATASPDTVEFTNTFIAVSSLPLTGGTTARDWLVYGGGMGLAALLAGAGFTVWRKRQLV